MDSFLDKLGRRLAGFERRHTPTGFAVAFSGGLDSTVLLTACRRLAPGLPLRALHVDHGLRSESVQWAAHCSEVARRLDVAFDATRIHVPTDSPHGLEAAARELRYQALGERLGAGEMLLTAHHEQDQLETVLLRMMRGAGVRGLRGILDTDRFAAGYLGRPFLTFAKAEIAAAAAAWDLEWIDDPANDEQRFDRNYLRSTVLPLLEARWPAAARTVARAAARMADAEALLGDLARRDAGGPLDPSRIPLALLRGLDERHQRNLLRQLFVAGDRPLPTLVQTDELIAAIGVTRRDAQSTVHWPGVEARVHGDYLYLLPESVPSPPAPETGTVTPGVPWRGPQGCLELVELGHDSRDAGLPDAWVRDGLSVRFRTGGERLRPYGSAHGRPLKKLLQEAGVVPWMRSQIPLLYRGTELVAVADLWVSDAARAERQQGRVWRLRWSDHAALY
jgi:tRNA(Ile)-lysidine synthase